MSTTFTLPIVKAQLVTKYATALVGFAADGGDIPADYAWPGGDTHDEHVYLGHKPDDTDLISSSSTVNAALATIKAGRKQRQETYQIEGTLISYRGDLSAAGGAQACELRAFQILEKLQDVHANDPRLGLAVGVIQWSEIVAVDSIISVYQAGYRAVCPFTVEVHGRLT